MQNTYHVALVRGENSIGHRPSTLVVEARRNIDLLDCEMWLYLGETTRTKRELTTMLPGLVTRINARYGTHFVRAVMD